MSESARSPAAGWSRIESILDALLDAEVESDAERRALLAQLCPEPDVRAQVEELWRSARSGSLFERPVTQELPDFLSHAESLLGEDGRLEGRRLGAYRLLEVIGRGGMGVVYSACRADDQFDKRVAVKLLPRGLEAPEAQRRFLTERQILADLEHPDIARLLDGGVTEEGYPFLVMELVDGTPLDEHCRRAGLGLDDRLEVFLSACGAVQYAHQHMVIHRDLKPSNILVSSDGRIKLLDFGVAKLVDPAGGAAEGQTVFQPRTLAFAAPEQLANEPVTTASDVYSLGVVLFHLLTGQGPHDLEGLSPAAAEREVREHEAPLASAVAAHRELAGRPVPVASRRLRGDLDNVVRRALEKDAARRYPTVEQLAQDLRRIQAGQPVSAREPTPWYRAAKLVSRHRVGFAASVLLALSLLAGLAGSAWQAGRRRIQAQRAQRVAGFLTDLFEAADPFAEGTKLDVRDVLDRGVERIERELANEPEVRSALLTSMGRSYDGIGDHQKAIELQRRALAIRTAEHGAASPEAASTATSLASALIHQGSYDEARSLLAEGSDLWRGLDPASPEAAAARRVLGELEDSLGDYAAAASAYRQALEVLRAVEPPPDLEIARVLSRLASALDWLGEDEAARAHLENALAIAEGTVGPDHAVTAGIRNNLALLLHGQGDLEGAETLYRKTLAIQERTLGPSHQDVGSTLTSLGKLLMDEGDYLRARPLLERAVAIQRESLDADNFFRIATEINLATLLREIGELDEAEVLYRGAEKRFERLLGDDNVRTARVRAHLGMTLWREGRLDEAEELLERALAVQRAPGTHVQHLAETLTALGGVKSDGGRPVEAEALLREAAGLFESVFDEDNWQLAEARSELARALLRQGRSREARPLLGSAYARLRSGRPEGDPRVARAEALVGELGPGT